MKPKLIVNDDASTFLLSGDDLTKDDLRMYLETKHLGTRVDLLTYCVSFGGGLCYYDTPTFKRFYSNGAESEDFWRNASIATTSR